MDENALKELTKQGCIVGRDAAESLQDEDIEMIQELETPPMYISEEMLTQLRSSYRSNGHSQTASTKKEPNGHSTQKQDQPNGHTSSGGTGQKTVQKEKVEDEKIEQEENKDSEDPGEEEMKEEVAEQKQERPREDVSGEHDYGETSSHFMKENTVTIKRDTRNRGDLRTKVEIVDEKDISNEEKDVPEFLQYYNDRYDKMKKLLMRRMEMKSATTINRLEQRDEGEEVTTIGMVNDKYSTNSGKYIVEIEDNTGRFKVLVDERDGDRIVPDEVLGISGSMGGDIIYADSIVRPDLPIPQGVKTTEDDVAAAYISDFHIGSIDTLDSRLDRFAEWLGSEEAEKIGYLVIPGDVVEGVGNYPGQEDELRVTDIYKQYELFEEWVEKVPEHIQIVLGPGNHDITRLAEPQPRLTDEVLPNISDFENVHLVQNPQTVRLHGFEHEGLTHLMYHGYSFDDQIDRIKELREKAYDDPHHVMIDLLKRRHLAPSYGSNLLSPEEEDHLVIQEKPDVFVAGHLHSHANESYKGVNVIATSTFQKQTDFQKRVGHEPDPGKVTIMNFKTRETEVKQF